MIDVTHVCLLCRSSFAGEPSRRICDACAEEVVQGLGASPYDRATLERQLDAVQGVLLGTRTR